MAEQRIIVSLLQHFWPFCSNFPSQTFQVLLKLEHQMLKISKQALTVHVQPGPRGPRASEMALYFYRKLLKRWRSSAHGSCCSSVGPRAVRASSFPREPASRSQGTAGSIGGAGRQKAAPWPIECRRVHWDSEAVVDGAVRRTCPQTPIKRKAETTRPGLKIPALSFQC